MRTIAILPALLLSPLATGCLHEPAVDFDDLYPAPAQTESEPVVRRDVTVAWAGAGDQAPVAALPASPRDRPPPDPVPFRIGAGHGALGHVDLAACRDEGLQPGYLRMRVTFRHDGRIVHAAVESPVPPPQEALDCIADQLEDALVPRFDGRDATLSKSLFIEPGDLQPEPEDTVVRKGGAPSHRRLTRTSAPITALTRP